MSRGKYEQYNNRCQTVIRCLYLMYTLNVLNVLNIIMFIFNIFNLPLTAINM